METLKDSIKYTLYLMGLISVIYWSGCNTRNIEDIKLHANEVFKKSQFNVIGYEGYQIGMIPQTPGGRVWYILESIPSNGIRYECSIAKWRGEYHLWELKSIDAIKPNQ